MHRAYPATRLIIAESVEDAIHMVDGLRKTPVTNGESMILDFGRLDTQERTALAKDAVVRYELPTFGEVNERADPCS
jgi:hypothetical protein